MSQKLRYHQQLSEIVTHSLLHLYTEVCKCGGRFVPVPTRNKIIMKWLKDRLKNKAYSEAKKEIKLLMLTGKKKSANLEQKLLELNLQNELYRAKFSNADKLYVLLSNLYEQYGVISRLVEPNSDEFEPEVLYMLPSEIEEGFDDNQKQLRPLNFFVKTESVDSLLLQLKAQACHHTANLDHVDDRGVAHFTLSFLDDK